MSDALAWVERFHDVVDELAAKVAAAHDGRLRCRAGCSGCCSDDLNVFELEADLIASRHPDVLEHEAPHPEGACAFLDGEGRCRVYDVRPYVCRTQGLPLRWIEEDDDGEIVEARDVCPLNEDGGPPLEELRADDLWTIGPFEERLGERQRAHDAGEGRRIALRTLFRRSEPAVPPARAAKHRLPIVR